ncbi:MAG: PTS transporter subunit EIIC [Collinsella sp.]
MALVWGIGTAFIVTSYKRNRDKTRAIILPLIITAILTCITEPMDFLFVFAAPVLFVVHAVLSGISLVLLKVLNIPAATAGGIINIVVSNLVLGVEKTNWPLMIVLGVINAALYFVVFTVLIASCTCTPLVARARRTTSSLPLCRRPPLPLTRQLRPLTRLPPLPPPATPCSI